jgi:DNA-binding CsgD family transcriptional regulator
MKRFPLKPQVFYSLFENFPAHLALLDEKGNIILTNAFWKKEAIRKGLLIRPDSIGYNYFELCERAEGEEKDFALKIKEGLSSVLKGKRPFFATLYELSYQNLTQSYLFLCFLIKGPPKLSAILHLEVPQEKRRLPFREGERDFKTTPFASLISLLQGSLIPLLSLLEGKIPEELEKTRKELLQNLLAMEKESLAHLNPLAILTTREAQIALLVKEGKTSEEIARLLGLGKDAVDFYRKRIREKLGLKGKGPSLRTYLQSLLGPTRA